MHKTSSRDQLSFETPSPQSLLGELSAQFLARDLGAQIADQFADVLASNEKWARRFAMPKRDYEAERIEDEFAEDDSNSPDVVVTYRQMPRFPRLAGGMVFAGVLASHARQGVLSKLFLAAADIVVAHRQASLHRKLVRSIGKDWGLGLTWEVSAQTTNGAYGTVSVRGNFTRWAAAIREGKFPGHNIPRISIERQKCDWREAAAVLEARLKRRKHSETAASITAWHPIICKRKEPTEADNWPGMK